MNFLTICLLCCLIVSLLVAHMAQRISNKILGASFVYTKDVKAACEMCVAVQVRGPTGIMKLVACPKGMHELTLSTPATDICRYWLC